MAEKRFSIPEQAGVTPPGEAELANARKLFAEFQRKVNAILAEDRAAEISPKFWDDTSGTEYELRKITQNRLHIDNVRSGLSGESTTALHDRRRLN